MSNVAISFASLVKSNNGSFKSEAQATFLLDQCQEVNVFTSTGSVYNSTFVLSYICDDKGVVKVEKFLPKTNRTEVTWVRLSDEEFKANQATQAARIVLQNEAESALKVKFEATCKVLEIGRSLLASKFNLSSEMAEKLFQDVESLVPTLEILNQDKEFSQAWAVYQEA